MAKDKYPILSNRAAMQKALAEERKYKVYGTDNAPKMTMKKKGTKMSPDMVAKRKKSKISNAASKLMGGLYSK